MELTADVLLQAGAAVSAHTLLAAASVAAAVQQLQQQPSPRATICNRFFQNLVTAAGSVDVQDSSGCTLTLAAQAGDAPAARLLLAAGANVAAKSNAGQSVLEEAVFHHPFTCSGSWCCR
jgi:hypothetical protein